MELVRICDTRDPLFSESMGHYRVSFPYHEQREEQSQSAIMGEGEYFFLVAKAGERAVGSILCWKTAGFTYVEHFYVYPSERGKGYGTEILNLLCSEGGTVILEIDPPVDDVSLRRKAFYERCGFKANPYEHIHPPYHQGCSGHELVVMSYPDGITREEYNAFSAYLNMSVMGR